MNGDADLMSDKQNRRVASASRDGGEHLKICDVCGQIFDQREQRQVQHHGSDEHAPLFPER